MADNAGPSRPRARLGAFSGGPLGIGWAPWAIGAAALAVGIFVFMRRGGGTGQAQGQAALPVTAQQPFPFPGGDVNPGSNPSAQQLQQAAPWPMLTAANPFTWGGSGHKGFVPLYSDPKPGESEIGSLVAPGTRLQQTGPAQYDASDQLLFYPVNYGSGSYFLANPNVGSNVSAQQMQATAQGQANLAA